MEAKQWRVVIQIFEINSLPQYLSPKNDAEIGKIADRERTVVRVQTNDEYVR